ncbi:hypothetical protein BDQ17DRAFT_1356557, partial [Cyathus striatus]
MNCHPNFEGAGVSVTNSAREWGVSGFHTGADVTSSSLRGPMLQNAILDSSRLGHPPPVTPSSGSILLIYTMTS